MGLTWRVSGKVVAEGVTAALALLAAAVSGDVILVALAAPLGLAVVLSLTARRPQPPVVTTTVTPLVVSPGEAVEISVEITASPAAGSRAPGSPVVCEVVIELPAAVRPEEPARWRLLLWPGRPELLSCKATVARPGRFPIGPPSLRFTDAAGAVAGVVAAGESVTIEVRPVPTPIISLVRPERVRATAGDRVARLSLDGIEFSEVREQQVGALERRVNWRATARRQATCVNLYHPERSTDIVLLIDTFSDAALPSVISVALNLAETYLTRHDRVGLICFGGVLDWVEPGTGPVHLDRLRASLLSSESYFSYAWKTAEIIPRRLFPAGCLVLAVSPLSDERFVSALASLRSKAHDLAVIEVDAEGLPPDAALSLSGSVAWRLLKLEREELRHRFWQLGVPVTTISGPGGVAAGLAEIAAFRRGRSARSGMTR
jgi:uncharacterized protein (DUF58 family)